LFPCIASKRPAILVPDLSGFSEPLKQTRRGNNLSSFLDREPKAELYSLFCLMQRISFGSLLNAPVSNALDVVKDCSIIGN
jgi:hypothetical protein